MKRSALPLAWRVRPRATVLQPEGHARRADRPRDVAAAVVTEHAPQRDAARREPGDRPLQKGGTGGAELVGEHFHVGDAAVVIDGHVHVLPADATGRAPAVAVDAMADLADAPERL